MASILQRHENLSVTRRALLQRVGRLEDEVEQSQRRLQTTEEERSLKKLVRPMHVWMFDTTTWQRREVSVHVHCRCPVRS